MMEVDADRSRQAHLVHQQLLLVYGTPEWRTPLAPLDELVSTILSQNTNDINRDRAFIALRTRFSNWEQVRDADPAEVVNAIRVAGLANQKGPRIQTVLRQITEQRGSLSLDFLRQWSTDEARAWLMQFNGVGPKTAAIVLLFSLEKPAFPVDTHIYRVTGRLGLRPAELTVEQAHVYLEHLIAPESYGPFHLNLIHLGRTVCHPRRPECTICPVQTLCDTGRKVLVES
jgi:endonuclease III